jgi:hypothetical protein
MKEFSFDTLSRISAALDIKTTIKDQNHFLTKTVISIHLPLISKNLSGSLSLYEWFPLLAPVDSSKHMPIVHKIIGMALSYCKFTDCFMPRRGKERIRKINWGLSTGKVRYFPSLEGLCLAGLTGVFRFLLPLTGL